MARGSIPRRRTPIQQPDEASTKIGQKRYAQGQEYDGQRINSELDYVHERINQVLPEASTDTEWAEYTPDITGFGTVANVSFFWRISNAMLEVRGRFEVGTPTAALASISLPDGQEMDAESIPGDTNTGNQCPVIGMSIVNISGGFGPMVAAPQTDTQKAYFGASNTGQPVGGTSLATAGLICSVSFSVPAVL